MLASVPALPLYEVVEIMGLVAGLSGLLVLGATVLSRVVFRIAWPQRMFEWPNSTSFLWPTMRKQGVYYLAVGGAMMTLSEIAEMVS
jgi:hypothetical protein